MKRPIIATLCFIIFFTAVFFHFHDGPPPDLSRFTRPAHDPVAFAEVKKITDEITANHKAYKIVEPGDPEEYPDDETQELDKLALQQNPNAVRALRRHLKENEATLAAAHRLFALEKIAFEALVPGNAFATRLDTIPGIKNALRMIHRETLLAGIEGRSAEVWDGFGQGLEFIRRSEKAPLMLTTGMYLLASEGIVNISAIDLAAFEKNPVCILRFLTVMEKNRPDPLQFKTAFVGELLGFADSVLPSRGGQISLRDPSVMGLGMGSGGASGMREWLNHAGKNTRAAWLRINTLPNDTVYEYGSRLDRELTMTTPPFLKSAENSKWGMWLLAKNSGGTASLDMFTRILPMVRLKYFHNAARHDLTRLALAIRVYQLTHDGNRPASLAALAPDILPSIPTDIFAGGAPFRYDAPTGKIWSVGTDAKDDGGDPSKDIVVAPTVLTPPPATPAAP